MTQRRTLSEPCRRVLLRLQEHMTAGATMRIEIDLHEGGVRAFRETQSWPPSAIPTADLKKAS